MRLKSGGAFELKQYLENALFKLVTLPQVTFGNHLYIIDTKAGEKPIVFTKTVSDFSIDLIILLWQHFESFSTSPQHFCSIFVSVAFVFIEIEATLESQK